MCLRTNQATKEERTTLLCSKTIGFVLDRGIGMAKDQKMLTYSVRVTLPESDVELLARGAKGTAEEELQRQAQSLLKQRASGGVMLSCHDVDTIAGLTGVRIRTAQEAIDAINAGAPLKDGKGKAILTIDPAFMPPLEEYCRVTGMTLDQFITQVWNLCVSQGYLFSVHVPDGNLYATHEDRQFLDEFMGTRAYTLADVVARMKGTLHPVGA